MRLEDQAAALSPAEIVTLLGERQAAQAERAQHLQRIAGLEVKNADLRRQVAWFKRQLFGRKSERRLLEPDARQLPLAGMLTAAEAPPPPTETVKAYQRRSRTAPPEDAPDESSLRFDSSVPVEVIAVPNPDLAGRSATDYEVVGEKVTYRLAQKPGAYVVLKYVRQSAWTGQAG